MKKLTKSQQHAYESLTDDQGRPVINIQDISSLGFPYKPSSMCYSPAHGYLVVGTETGKLFVLGRPGCSITFESSSFDMKITHIEFINDTKNLLTVCKDISSWHVMRWSIKDDKNSLEMEGNVKIKELVGNVTATCVRSDGKILYMGTCRGSMYVYNISLHKMDKFVLTEAEILRTECIKKYLTKLGPIQKISQCQAFRQKILIGYSNGSIIVWDANDKQIVSFVTKKERLYSLCWGTNASMFVSCHSNGLICCWTLSKTSRTNDIFFNYLPVPFRPRNKISCQAITKILWKDSFFIFTGGLPDSISYEKHTMSIMSGGTITRILEFGSEIIDFCLIASDSCYHPDLGKNSFFIVILTQQEMVTVLIEPRALGESVLTEQGYQLRQVIPFHLTPSNSSCITENIIVPISSANFLNKLFSVGRTYIFNNFTTDWPLSGNFLKPNTNLNKKKYVIITGHEDGSVFFWNCYDHKLSPIVYKIDTSSLYILEDEFDCQRSDKCKPIDSVVPIKLGFYDPYCDDPRYAIQKLHLCEKTFTLLVGGSAGNVLIFKFVQTVENPTKPYVVNCNITQRSSNFIWKGHEKLKLKDQYLCTPGYILDTMISIYPPTPISSIAYCSKWGLMAIGTCYGCVLYDCDNKIITHCICTYETTGIKIGGQNIQRNSFLRSLRNSFRRLSKKKRLVQNYDEDSLTDESQEDSSRKSFLRVRTQSQRFATSFRDSIRLPGRRFAKMKSEGEKIETRAEVVTRYIGGKKVDPIVRGLIKSICFAECAVSEHSVRSMVVYGTQYGKMYILFLKFQIFDGRMTLKTVESMREIQMNHKAPIINMFLVDNFGRNVELTHIDSIVEYKTPPVYFILCCTEEQVRLINLQTLKTKMKMRFTANHGNRLRKAFLFTCVYSNNNPASRYLAGYSSQGKLHIFSLYNLKCLKTHDFVLKDDKLAISTVNMEDDSFGILQSSHSLLRVFTIKNLNLIQGVSQNSSFQKS